MKKFKSTRTGQIAEIVSESDNQVVIRLENGDEKSISPATLKRQWKVIEEPQSEQIVINIIQESNTEKSVKEPAKDIKENKKSQKNRVSGDHSLRQFIESLAIERNTEIFIAKVKGFRSLKVDGKMYMAFTFNKKGVTLWMRSAAIQDIITFNKTNHMFDARVKFNEDNEETRNIITQLLDANLQFQIIKQAAKKTKETKKTKQED